ncbi:MAG: hypothetical protein ABIM99_03180 [Candidatus Dojkabacteria bacterium]
MEGYNSKQKLYISIAIGIFIIINILALIFALPFLNKGSVKGLYTDSVNASVFINGNIEKQVKFESDKNIENKDSSLYIKNINFTLFALPQAVLDIEGNQIEIVSGIYYLDTSNETIVSKDFDITISANSRVIIDAQEGNVYVLKGKAILLDKTINAGFVLNYNATTLSSNLLDKGQLLSTNKAKELNKLIATKSLFIPELNFVSIPSLELKDNVLEINAVYPLYKIEGTVNPLSHVYIGDTEATILEDGSFFVNVNLKNGINNFQINVVDEVSNTLSQEIKIILNN